jgi:hypothetical protein
VIREFIDKSMVAQMRNYAAAMLQVVAFVDLWQFFCKQLTQ